MIENISLAAPEVPQNVKPEAEAKSKVELIEGALLKNVGGGSCYHQTCYHQTCYHMTCYINCYYSPYCYHRSCYAS